MADYPISNVSRRIVYTGSAGVGPYAFSFEVLLDTDINVYKNDVLLTLTTDYTVSISPTLGTGTVTLVVAATSDDRITIVGSRPIERSSDFTTGGDFFAGTLNVELDSQTILLQQVAETAERSIKAPVTDPTNINMTLPINTSRAGKTLAFDADGNPVPGDPIGNFRGDWAAGVSYQNRDIVKDTTNDNIYLAIVPHTSSGSLPIDTNTDVAKWALVVDAEAAGTARIAAEAAQTAAEAAQTAAELAETNAETAETNAETAETNAGNSATAAASSASSASTSATNASNSASAASTSETNAASSASAASTSATNASNSASAASSSASAAATSESNAATSESNAATSASTATTQAGIATTQASNASTSASNAATSETNAANSASAASTSAANAAASYDDFDDRYLGAKSTAPTLDNDGDALITGALYFDTVDNAMKIWDGSVWLDAFASLSGALIANNNLSDLSNVTTARENLGVEIGVDVQAYDADTTKNDVANTFTANQVISVTDNTNAALRITQLGTGNALVVEDETNPDSTPFVINASGNVINGYNSTINYGPFNPRVQSHSVSQNAGFAAGTWVDNAGAPNIFLGKSRGAIGTQTIVQSGDGLGNIRFYGSDGTSFIEAAAIYTYVDGTPGTNDMPARLVFSTTADGASSPTERMLIDSSGNLLFNSGYGSVATAYGCRAWVNFNGAGTVAIRASGNVSSITDTATGRYAVNFTAAMPDTNYSTVVTCNQTMGNSAQNIACGIDDTGTTNSPNGASLYTTSAVRVSIQASDGGNEDMPNVSVAIFR